MPSLLPDDDSPALLGPLGLGLGSDAPETDTLRLPCDAQAEHASRNFAWLALHQVMLRIGWIFKTESIVIPFFMDMIGGGPMLRGSLMLFNRMGLSIPPVLFARTLKLMPQKRVAIGLLTFGMAVPFAILSALWASGVWRAADGRPAVWMPYLFLAIYGVFFAMTGMNQLAMHSTEGKLVRAQRRGRLLATVVLLGGPVSIGCAWWLMPRWLALPDGGFAWLFAAPALLFALASLTMLGIREQPDDFQEPRAPSWRRMRDAWRLMTTPGPCRGIAFVALLYSTMFTLFPHYQALPRESLGEGGSLFDLRSLMVWTVTQHTAVTLLSLLTGPLADRFGNRLAVRLMVFGSASAPLAAIALATLPVEMLARWYWLVFLPLGFTPVTIKVLINYTLELVDREEHPRYISAIGLCLALPVMIGSPIVGWLIGQFGIVPIFAIGACLLLAAGVQTLGLLEPRHSR